MVYNIFQPKNEKFVDKLVQNIKYSKKFKNNLFEEIFGDFIREIVFVIYLIFKIVSCDNICIKCLKYIHIF